MDMYTQGEEFKDSEFSHGEVYFEIFPDSFSVKGMRYDVSNRQV